MWGTQKERKKMFWNWWKKRKEKKMGVVDCVFNVSKKEKKKNLDMTHEKN